MRMNPHRREDLGVALRQSNRPVGRFQVGPWIHDLHYPCLTGAFNNRVPISIELREVQVGVGINQRQHVPTSPAPASSSGATLSSCIVSV